MTTKDSKKATRELVVITRYQMKKSTEQYAKGTVILVCENDRGVRYTIVLRPNKVHSCTCKHYTSTGRATCYHLTTLKAVENARAAARVAQMRAAAPVTVEMPAPAKDISTAPLHNNRGFSLLKTA